MTETQINALIDYIDASIQTALQENDLNSSIKKMVAEETLIAELTNS
jgi:hypothetical protein